MKHNVGLSRDDIWIILCALDRYSCICHPDNSGTKDVKLLRDKFSDLYEGAK